MSVFWWIIAALVAVVWVFTAVDIFRRHYSGWTTFGWLVLIIVLPFVGSIIYWALRKPTQEEVEQARMAEADLRHGDATRSIGNTTTRL